MAMAALSCTGLPVSSSLPAAQTTSHHTDSTSAPQLALSSPHKTPSTAALRSVGLSCASSLGGASLRLALRQTQRRRAGGSHQGLVSSNGGTEEKTPSPPLVQTGRRKASRVALVASQPWRAPSLHHSPMHRSTLNTNSVSYVRCSADPASASTSTSGSSGSQKKEGHVDTRIHWGNSTEGWIGDDGEPAASFSGSRSRGRSKAGILDQAPDSHYRYMGVSPDAEVEEIKAAYRRLSKQYHPDTTSLPLEIAAQKFMRLKDAYDTLSNEELRNLYDRRLESKIASALGGSFYLYESRYTQQGYDTRTSKKPEPVNVDTLGGRNMELSGQAQTALAFDLFVLFVCICVIMYVVFIKQASS